MPSTFSTGLFASPSAGLFHLKASADLGSPGAMLALACLHLQLRPRKGVLAALVQDQYRQTPLPPDPAAATHFTVIAAKPT
jgi:hypothetical protein